MKYGKGEVLGRDLMHEMHVVAFEGGRVPEKWRVCVHVCVCVCGCVCMHDGVYLTCDYAWMVVCRSRENELGNVIPSEGWKYGCYLLSFVSY